MYADLHYERIQAADLYAHFSPVGLINHKKFLSDFSQYCGDTIGVTSSIWDRIKKVGEDRFYRVTYPKNSKGKEMDDKEKRIKDKQEVEGKLKSKMINTSLANSDYIKFVIDAFVNKNKVVEDKLYQETK